MKDRYLYSTSRVTAVLNDDIYLWQAFLGTTDESIVYKSDTFSPDVNYWDLDVAVTRINSFIDDTTYVYGATEGTTSLGIKIKKDSITDISYYTIPAGINEGSIDLIDDTNYIYFLTPGNTSGENTKIIKYNKSTRIFVETIDLSKSGSIVTNAKKIDIDNSGNLWVVSETNPVILTKVFYTGLTWDFTNYTLS